MAETLLRPVIQKLVDLLGEEASLLKGVHKEVKSLKRELEIIEPFLRDAEAKSERKEFGEATNVWLNQIREDADRIEDVIDDYLYSVEQHRSSHKARRFIMTLKPSRRIASEIRAIGDSLRKIKEQGQSYGLRPLEQGSSSDTAKNNVDPRLIFRSFDESELVGIDRSSNELIQTLVKDQTERMVISLVGEGGIGKTTLAKKVYDDLVVKSRFECRVWITVSQPYDIQKIFAIMKSKICPTATDQIMGHNNELTEDLIDLLRSNLETKRYLIVFDDVWQTEFWDYIQTVLPSNDKSSRIIVTTRNTKVADSFKEMAFDIVQELKPWPPKQVWELFCMKAFYSNSEGFCPPELEELSDEIVTKCHGLPLVIVALAGLLSKKEMTKLEWKRVLNALDHNFEANHKLASVSKILLLSYQDLPYHLKPCFLYFGIFPQDFLIWEDRLYELWIAEGFIALEVGMSLEQVAENYLNELACRNLVSFVTRNLGYQRWFRVHDLFHDIISTKADKLRFSRVVDESKSRHNENIRRLSIHITAKDAWDGFGSNKVRSVFLFDIRVLNKCFAKSLFRAFKLLTVLDFKDAPLDNLPKEVGNLVHLKSLNLRRTNLKKLPNSIGKLQNLQVLDVYDTLVRELPVGICKLTKLRSLQAYCRLDHEIGGYHHMGVRVHKGLVSLVELQKLDTIEAYPIGFGLTQGLERLKKLKVLSISNLTGEIGTSLGAALEKMDGLEKLCLTFVSEDEVLDLEQIKPPPCLRYLKLSCRLLGFSCFAPKLRNLQGLHMEFSRLAEEPLKWLSGSPNLEYLFMYKAYDGEELRFEEGCFKGLKKLFLRQLEGLKVVKIERGSMPGLEELQLGILPYMEEIPLGIQNLTNLRLLTVLDMKMEFVLRLQPNGGPDYWKIQNIPSVQFWYRIGSLDLLHQIPITLTPQIPNPQPQFGAVFSIRYQLRKPQPPSDDSQPQCQLEIPPPLDPEIRRKLDDVAEAPIVGRGLEGIEGGDSLNRGAQPVDHSVAGGRVVERRRRAEPQLRQSPSPSLRAENHRVSDSSVSQITTLNLNRPFG